jgi:hypothetical protein
MTSVCESVHARGCATNAAWAGVSMKTLMPVSAQPMHLLPGAGPSSADFAAVFCYSYAGMAAPSSSLPAFEQVQHSDFVTSPTKILPALVLWTESEPHVQQTAPFLVPPTVLGASAVTAATRSHFTPSLRTARHT